jgi:hypothetical protein
LAPFVINAGETLPGARHVTFVIHTLTGSSAFSGRTGRLPWCGLPMAGCKTLNFNNTAAALSWDYSPGFGEFLRNFDEFCPYFG